MGIFDTYIINCPHCGQEVEEQRKPGYMNTFYFGMDKEMEIEFVGNWFCISCSKGFSVELETLPVVIVKKDLE